MRQARSAIVIPASVVILAFALAVPGTQAADSKPAPEKAQPPQGPEEQALALYNEGLALNDRARKMERQLPDTPEGAKRDRLLQKITASYDKSIPLLAEATQQNPGLYQAFSELGYAYRKTGKFDASLEAYGKALTLEPNYTPAIEYRAEAYLGLNRVDEAKQAYAALLASNPGHAQELLAAMRRWVAARRAAPGDVSAKTLSEVERWIEQRAASAGDEVGHNMPDGKRDW